MVEGEEGSVEGIRNLRFEHMSIVWSEEWQTQK